MKLLGCMAAIAILLMPARLYAQTAYQAPLQYAVRYVQEHVLLQRDSDFTVVDADIEWPEVMEYRQPMALRHAIVDRLLGGQGSTLDSAYAAYKAQFGQPVIGQLPFLPADDRFCDVTLQARIKSYELGRWICYMLMLSQEPQRSSPVKAVRATAYIVYDMVQDRVLNAEDLIRRGTIQSGNVYQEFFDTLYTPLSDELYARLLHASIDGVWLEQRPRRVGFHVDCQTEGQQLGYEVSMAYDGVRYLMTKECRRLMEKKAQGQPAPAFVSPASTWQGDTIYNKVDEAPQFCGGQDALKQYLGHVDRPAGSEPGRVLVSFVVGKDGRVHDPTVVVPFTPELDRHAIALVKGMPPFMPGMHHAMPVCVRMYLPVSYR